MPRNALTALEAIKKVLKSGDEMLAPAICAEAVKLTDLKGKTPKHTIYATMLAQSKKKDGLVVKTGPSTFRLRKENETGFPRQKAKPAPKKDSKPTRVTADTPPAEPVVKLPATKAVGSLAELDAQIEKRETERQTAIERTQDDKSAQVAKAANVKPDPKKKEAPAKA
jgi:hypothetical protein